MKKLDQATIGLYGNGLTLRQIADIYETNHHSVKRYLVKNGVQIERRYRSNVTDESRAKMSQSAVARGGEHLKGPKQADQIFRMQATKLGTDRDLSCYTDREKLMLLTRYTSKHEQLRSVRFEFIDRFYNDPQLSAIWVEWKTHGECKWWRPSLDHKTPISRGGTFALDNLHFLTWFENRAKAEMTEEEWTKFQKDTGTTSAVFVRVNMR